MRKIIYGLFMVFGFVGSLFATPQSATASIDPTTTEKVSFAKNAGKDLLYFADIVEKQNTSNFVAAHYSHRSHSSHRSHQSHYSSY